MVKVAVLFGGNGFIGSYLAELLLTEQLVDKVVLADLVHDETFWPKRVQEFYKDSRIIWKHVDVRRPIDLEIDGELVLTVNLAAVHREPGHQPNEYFETNLPGAENVCDWAGKQNCKSIIFTSSIAVYGASEHESQPKIENSLPTPNSPYGISKLVAEKIHLAWQKAQSDRKLTIVRPGVIFGAGEKGNVTRMVRAIIGRYFAFTGNKQTRKAGGYVKELCRAIVWMYQHQLQNSKDVVIFNFSVNPTPTIEQFADAIQKVYGRPRTILSMPYGLLWIVSAIWFWFFRLIGKSTGINPVRVQKLRRSNFILAKELESSGYQYSYTLESAMADWKQERPEDWM